MCAEELGVDGLHSYCDNQGSIFANQNLQEGAGCMHVFVCVFVYAYSVAIAVVGLVE